MNIRYAGYCDCCLAPIDLRLCPDELCDECSNYEEQQIEEMELEKC